MSKEIIQIQKDDGTEQFPETVAEAVQVGEKHLDEVIKDVNDSIEEAGKSVHTKNAATSPATPDTSVYTKGEVDLLIATKINELREELMEIINN